MLARLRAWLIALIREAVRAELDSEDQSLEIVVPDDHAFANTGSLLNLNRAFAENYAREKYPGRFSVRTEVGKVTPVVPSVVRPEASFERMQDESLRRYEEHYAEKWT